MRHRLLLLLPLGTTACSIPGLSSGARESHDDSGPMSSFDGPYTITVDGPGAGACPDGPAQGFSQVQLRVAERGDELTASFEGELAEALVAYVGTATLTGTRGPNEFTTTARRATGEGACAAEAVATFTWRVRGSSWSGELGLVTTASDAACGVAACDETRAVSGLRYME